MSGPDISPGPTPTPGATPPTDDNKRHAERLEEALFEVKRVIVGQDRMVERAMICLLARGHCLIEGVPGLAKTLTVSTLAEVVGGSFTRLQFTPDLVPGRHRRHPRVAAVARGLRHRVGPDLREPRARRRDQPRAGQGAVGAARGHGRAPRLDRGTDPRRRRTPFLVLATQNPIESEGVYALPEAQRDRFLMQIVVGQPSYVEELEIARRMGVQRARSGTDAHDRAARRAAEGRRRDLRAPRGAGLRGAPRHGDA